MGTRVGSSRKTMSRLVIDVGCATYGGEQSIQPLIDEFQPDVLIGFDPSSALANDPPVEFVPLTDGRECLVIRLNCAAWTFSGTVTFEEANTRGRIVGADEGDWVHCADLARVIIGQADRGSEVILKLDCEGAEYELVPHLRATGADERITLALIEWHCSTCGFGIWDHDAPHPGGGCAADLDEWRLRRSETEALLRCEARGWNL